MKLTPEILFKLGFRGEGRDFVDTPAYRISPKGYDWDIQIVLGDYPDTNPNCGIISLHQGERKDEHCLTVEKDKGQRKFKHIDHVLWRSDGEVGGIKYITFQERTVPIAHYVNTLERLNAIYTALTGLPPLEIRKNRE